MALIGRLFAILFGFLAACLVAGMIVVAAVLFPEFSDFASGPIDPSALNIVLGFGFVDLRGRRRRGRPGVLSRPDPVRSRDTFLRWHRPASSRDHDRCRNRRGPRLLDDRGPQRRRLARAAAPAAASAAVAVAFTVPAAAFSAIILRCGLLAGSRRMSYVRRMSYMNRGHPSRLARARTSRVSANALIRG